ncbi:hypothetical protein ACLKA6_006504 [Drosophila palustris]
MFGHGRSSVNVRSPFHNCTIIKMFKALLICTIVGLAVAFPNVEVIKDSKDVRADGFDAYLETSDGTSETRSGDVHGIIQGTISWVSPEGDHVDIKYVADEHGYQPSGAHLPTPPPVPEAILKSLAYIAAHPSKDSH